jgi:hypothetical protein
MKRDCGKRVLRRLFKPKRDEVTGGFRKLGSKELCNFPSSQNTRRTNNTRIILKYILREVSCGVNFIHLARNKDDGGLLRAC